MQRKRDKERESQELSMQGHIPWRKSWRREEDWELEMPKN